MFSCHDTTDQLPPILFSVLKYEKSASARSSKQYDIMNILQYTSRTQATKLTDLEGAQETRTTQTPSVPSLDEYNTSGNGLSAMLTQPYTLVSRDAHDLTPWNTDTDMPDASQWSPADNKGLGRLKLDPWIAQSSISKDCCVLRYP